ncbi:hypothetical protein [Candidatus Protochlamydia phocaeensis]|uniref:hypothetical protein n=1 Tax=Candidatus Protochlamydia phocaeensis TaxID=1414722 RepID=UPI000838309C|nr:hypothetical protein [Candidatus Protochlamydia phocaeensis]
MNDRRRKHLQEALDKNPSCYVLITCGEPSEDGQMQVEMTYQGDATLASYLIQGAQLFIDQEEDDFSGSQTPIRLVK